MTFTSSNHNHLGSQYQHQQAQRQTPSQNLTSSRQRGAAHQHSSFSRSTTSNNTNGTEQSRKRGHKTEMERHNAASQHCISKSADGRPTKVARLAVGATRNAEQQIGKGEPSRKASMSKADLMTPTGKFKTFTNLKIDAETKTLTTNISQMQDTTFSALSAYDVLTEGSNVGRNSGPRFKVSKGHVTQFIKSYSADNKKRVNEIAAHPEHTIFQNPKLATDRKESLVSELAQSLPAPIKYSAKPELLKTPISSKIKESVSTQLTDLKSKLKYTTEGKNLWSAATSSLSALLNSSQTMGELIEKLQRIDSIQEKDAQQIADALCDGNAGPN